ncbi:discoidin domain-containing receptor 2 [Orussus abietinus]|uniref:discoidin domain-containing receptor 2 n=1 Tax=Orussus abietinus TaxID=222816 RepID=UPI00062519FD|nr:discoidin domain-containing receptor 2 [Orussus abietinus]
MEAVVLLIEVLVVSALCAEEPIKNVSGQCMLPLGMEEGKIPDDAITASSSYEMKSVGPQNARIRQEKNGGAWCPKAQISSDIREYLEVDLTKDHLITWTETQGRFGNGQGQEYAEAFFLEYWRDVKWHQYKNLRGDRVLRGNSNTYLVEKQKLDLPFVASRVRFVPYSQHPRTVCMRVEIYGCVWEQRIARYSAPKGEQVGPNGRTVEDTSYDGVEDDGLMVGGLGQLTDGLFGDDPDVITSGSSTNWVGWSDRDFVELVFEFDEVREFENCSVHTANLPKREVEAPAAISVWFSYDGKRYHPNPERLEFSGDIRTPTGVVSVPLQSRTGRFAKVVFRPRSKWLLISEVTFESVSGSRNFSGESLDQLFRACENDTDSESDLDGSGPGYNETIFEINANLTPDAFPVSNSQTYIGLVSGALTVGALLLTCTVFLMKQRGRNKVALLQKHTALLCGSPAPGITINMKDIKLATPIVVNGLSQSRLSVKSKTYSGDEHVSRSGENTASSEYEHCSVYERTYKLFSEENLAYEPHTHKSEHFSSCKTDYTDVTDFTSERSFPDDKPMDRVVPTPYPVKRLSQASSKASHEVYEGYYAATDILTIKRREQHSTSSLFTSLHIQDSMHLSNTTTSYNIQHISRHRLRILDKLGEGSFGLVHLCEAKGILSPDLGTTRNRQVVIVRSLWRGVTDSLRKDFMKDMYVLAALRDPNIARITALVEEEPFGAVFEYGELGDLPFFLRKREKSSDDLPLSYDCLLSFVGQIASGMKYLENLNIPHRDLAARNCIVNKNLTIKVSDHAMYCSKYEQDYYVNEYYAKIPLRWMAWEAVLLGKQTCQADVWSYAVTVWEILTSCEDQPFADLTSEQVLENFSKWYHRGTTEKNQPRLPPQPSLCSRDLYHMMTKCWSRHAEDRPTFEEIHLFLKRLSFD